MKFLILSCILTFGASLKAQEDVTKLIGAMLSETPIEENLQELCDEIGGRVTGSKANEASVDWAYNKFKEAGLEVEKDPFIMPVLWLPEYTNVKINGDSEFRPNAVAKYQSPPGKYSGQLVYAGMGTEEDFVKLGSDLSGKFVLVESDLCLDINGLFAEYTMATNVEAAARKGKASGIIFMASRPKGLLYRFITSMATKENLPQLVMVREDAKRCIRLLREGKNLNLEMNINAQIGGEFTSHNVIAEIKGTERAGEVVVIGAHLDSWALGTGANDNGCNVSMMIDIARQMKKLGIKPKRTIRFALWNGEEQGYFGSWDYTMDHLDEMDKHIMALSVDIGSGAITGFFTNGREELIPAVDKVLAPVSAFGDFTSLNIPIIGTDNFDFMLQGVGNLVANHKPAGYGVNYHAASDTYDKVDLKSLKINSAIIAALTLGFANLDDDDITWKRQGRDEINEMFKVHKTEYSMRMFNVWEPWVNQERGRK